MDAIDSPHKGVRTLDTALTIILADHAQIPIPEITVDKVFRKDEPETRKGSVGEWAEEHFKPHAHIRVDTSDFEDALKAQMFGLGKKWQDTDAFKEATNQNGGVIERRKIYGAGHLIYTDGGFYQAL